MNRWDWQVNPELALAATLPSSAYRDLDFYQAEKEKIFLMTWQPVGRAEQVAKAGDYFTAEVAGEPVVVVKGNDGQVRAFSNVCRHRGSLIARGSGCSPVLQCPYHAWTYNLKGELNGAPEFEGVGDWNRSDVRLPQLKAETWGPFVFVHFGNGAPSLSQVLGAIPGEIESRGYPFSQYRFLTRTEYVVKCNWKVYVDNYLEGYHLPLVHPALYRELDYKEYRVDTFDYYSSQYAPLRPVTAGNADSRRYDPSKGAPEPLYYWVYPNFMVNVYPDNLHMNVVLPLGIDSTLTIFDWFVAPGFEGNLESTIAFSDQVQKEDMAICELVQRGLQSRSYDRGRYSAKRENGVHHFHRLVDKSLSV